MQKRIGNYMLWGLQLLLALLFALSGAMKLILPIDSLTMQFPLPGLVVRLIGTLEILGALGLVLPGIFHIMEWLTSLAACGLALLMIGAIVFTLLTSSVVLALIPLTVGLLAMLIAYGRCSRFEMGP